MCKHVWARQVPRKIITRQARALPGRIQRKAVHGSSSAEFLESISLRHKRGAAFSGCSGLDDSLRLDVPSRADAHRTLFTSSSLSSLLSSFGQLSDPHTRRIRSIWVKRPTGRIVAGDWTGSAMIAWRVPVDDAQCEVLHTWYPESDEVVAETLGGALGSG
jgi:hypothetical protein